MDHKTRIAIVSNTMCIGGVEIALLEMLKVFDYQRYDVTLYLREPGGALFDKLNNNIEIRYWGQINPKQQFLRQIKGFQMASAVKSIIGRMAARHHIDDWARNEYASVKSLGTISEAEYDIVIAYHGATPGVLATALYALRGRKKIAWIHGRDSFPNIYPEFWGEQYCKFDRIACVSVGIQDCFTDQYPATQGLTSVLYNLLDAERVIRLSEESVPCDMYETALLTVGRLAQVKGQIMIPATTRILLDAGYNIYWFLVGDGELRNSLEEKILEFRVQDRVILLGAKDNPYPYIKNCKIYVQPSFSEGYCTTTIEAKILCKPIVTTDAPGMQEQFVSGENGLIVDNMTPEALASGIAKLLDNPHLQEKFVDALQMKSCDNSKELERLYSFLEGCD